jgi:DNA invertase Pin-like site-specific DNA recombinase
VSTIAAYIRVSSRSQSLELQRAAIEQAANVLGETIGEWFSDTMSGKKLDRPGLGELRLRVRKGEISRVYVFRLDRLARSGIRDTLAVVEEMRHRGCKLVSIADGFDVDGPCAEIVLAVMAWAAQMEREAISERICAARTRIEAAGGRWGRPGKAGPAELERARTLKKAGLSVRKIAQATGIPRSTIARAVAGQGHYAKDRGDEIRMVACPKNLPGPGPTKARVI